MVKPNVKKGDKGICFLARCHVFAEMRKKQYIVYVHLDQSSGDVVYAKCCCPAGVGSRCKHVAATLFQLLDYVELGLSDIPDDKTCTQEIQQWHVPKKSTAQEALLFEDLISPQDTYEKDKKGRKRAVPEGKKDSYSSTSEKVCKGDLERLKAGLEEARSTCYLTGVLADTDCEPCKFDVNALPSRQRIVKAKQVGNKLEKTFVRSTILSKLDLVPASNICKEFISTKLNVGKEGCHEIEKNTRQQSQCKEWYEKRKCRLTASMFGVVVKRRKSIYLKSIVKTITKPSQTKNASCLWGTENEKNALLRYHQYKDESNLPVNICASCGLVVNPKWPWLGASPDALISDEREESVYGAVEVKCPASKSGISVLEACSDKAFCMEIIDGKPSLKKNHIYYYQSQGVMVICQLKFLDFVVYTVSDVYVERIYFNEKEWQCHYTPQLTEFYFEYLMVL